MKKIIALVDFSSNSMNAAKYAADLALSISAELSLLHVLQISLIAREMPATEQVFEEIQDSALESLNDLKKTLLRRTGGKIHISSNMEHGTVKHRLNEYCKQREPYIVVMGIAGNSLLRNIVGSNTLNAVNHLPYSLIIVPENANFRPIHEIGVACDLTTAIGVFPVNYLKELQQTFGARFELLYVNTENEKEPSATALNLLKEQIQGLQPDFHFATTSKLDDGMNRLLEDTKADLLLVIPKKHPIFEFHRSQFMKLALHCPVPVMVIHQ